MYVKPRRNINDVIVTHGSFDPDFYNLVNDEDEGYEKEGFFQIIDDFSPLYSR